MIPILFDKNAAGHHTYAANNTINGWSDAPDPHFLTIGIGMLSDAEKCTVTEELNGEIELSMVYPVEGVHYESIEKESLIGVKLPEETFYFSENEPARKFREDIQIFRVYSISKPINKKITIKAEHITYRLAEIPVKSFHGTGGILHVLNAFKYMGETGGQAIYQHPYTFETNFANIESQTFDMDVPGSIRQCMGDGQKMMLDKEKHEDWKDGVWLFDNFNSVFLTRRGSDKSSYIQYRYGENLSDFSEDMDMTSTITGIFPYFHTESADGLPYDRHGNICYASNPDVGTTHRDFINERIQVVDIEQYFEDEEKEDWEVDEATNIRVPTVAQINAKAQKALLDFDYVCKPQVTLQFTPVDLKRYVGFEELAENLANCTLGDEVMIIFREYGIEVKKRVIKIEYNILEEMINNLTVGDPVTSLAATIDDIGQAIEANRAGIIINKDSLLLYVKRADGRLGSQIYMDDDEIRSTVAGYHDDWNMIPILGSTSIGGENWTIHLYNYGDPTAVTVHEWDPDTQDWQRNIPKYDNTPINGVYPYDGYNYFDQESGAVWECPSSTHQWRHKKWTKDHGKVGSGTTLPTADEAHYQMSFLRTSDNTVWICEILSETDTTVTRQVTIPGEVTYTYDANTQTETATKGADQTVTRDVTQKSFTYHWVLKDNQVCQLRNHDAYAEKTEYTTMSEVKQTESSWELSINNTNGKLTQIYADLDTITQKVSSSNGALQASITVQANRITQEVTDRTSEDALLSGRIDVTAQAITSEVSRATTSEGVIASTIQQTANSINAWIKNDYGLTTHQRMDLSGWSVTTDVNGQTAGIHLSNGASPATAEITMNLPSFPSTDMCNVYWNIRTGWTHWSLRGPDGVEYASGDYTDTSRGATLRTQDGTQVTLSSPAYDYEVTTNSYFISTDANSYMQGVKTEELIGFNVWHDSPTAIAPSITITAATTNMYPGTTQNAQITFTGMVQFLDLTGASGTIINGGAIDTDTLVAKELQTKVGEDEAYVWIVDGRILFEDTEDPPAGGRYKRGFFGKFERPGEWGSVAHNNYTKWIQESHSTNDYSSSEDTWYGIGMYLAPNAISTSARARVMVPLSGGGLDVFDVAYTFEVNNSSSIRYKNSVRDLDIYEHPELDPHNLYDVHIKQFMYNEDAPISDETDSHKHETVIGFIAEDLDILYPNAVNYDEYRRPDSWSQKYMIPPMLYLIQEQHKEIESLKQEVADLKEMMNDILTILQNKEGR